MASAYTIAIIDDEVDLVNLFQEALEHNGFKVCAFTDPIQAFNSFRENNPRIRIRYFLDYRMPEA